MYVCVCACACARACVCVNKCILSTKSAILNIFHE